MFTKDEGGGEGGGGAAGQPCPSEARELRLETGQWFSAPARTPVGSEDWGGGGGGHLRVQAGALDLTSFREQRGVITFTC